MQSTDEMNMGNSVSTLLLRSGLWDVGIQWAGFAVAAALKTEKFYDLAGSGTFLFLAIQTLRWGNTFYFRQKVQTGMVATWAVRLGLFLFTRVLHAGGDSRFDKVKGNPKTFFIYWTIQALWVWLTLLPTMILNSEKRDKPLGLRDYAGWGLWTAGFLLEAVADYQKTVFKADPDNAGKFISTGLWSISRHPNYLGEILLWAGLYLSSSSVMSGYQHLSVISPIFVYLLLTRVSGVPILERQGMKRYGKDPAYLDYVKNTALLLPGFW
ncbi:uncharacterized protein [Amphiura filiformis]|uniref:uncharacterized protein n=1 Tax=Amphiura filiformis TaxID=82378 RepID=UPI003B214CBC